MGNTCPNSDCLAVGAMKRVTIDGNDIIKCEECGTERTPMKSSGTAFQKEGDNVPWKN